MRGRRRPLLGTTAALALLGTAASASEPSAPSKAWSGFYFGAHAGKSWGDDRWSAYDAGAAAPVASGSFGTYQPFDAFFESGSFNLGVQLGYNVPLARNIVAGIEVDVSSPGWPSVTGLTTGGVMGFTSPANGPQTFSENVVQAGTVRGRLGYAMGSWLLYGTGGWAWTYNKAVLTDVATGDAQTAKTFRSGWVAGAGVELPILPQWTGKVEYLYTHFPTYTVAFDATSQRLATDWSQHQLRVGLNYQFDAPKTSNVPAGTLLSADRFSISGQATFVQQMYPAFRSPYAGDNSLPGGGLGRQTFDATLYLGVRLWKGGELWLNPEIDQGFGVANTHGAAGYPSGESYKLGSEYPYARIQRAFIRQTVNLGGKTEEVEADVNQFAGKQSANRLVFTLGRFSIADVFDTNKYANNPKSDFFNWSLINAGSLDYAGDGWGFSYGAAAEWYQGNWTYRGGIFDLSDTPAGGNSPTGYGLDPTFSQYAMVAEIERRHELWGQPGKVKVTGFLNHGRAGRFADAIALSQSSGQPADINAVRKGFTDRMGISLNIEQQISENIGFFARLGWADGSIEPWDFTDIDRTVAAGLSIAGKGWGRPEDTIGIAGVLNAITGTHQAFFNAGGLGVLIGDGQLPNPGTEKILETYYSYALTRSTKLTLDYQFIANPAYNADRGPISLLGFRAQTKF